MQSSIFQIRFAFIIIINFQVFQRILKHEGSRVHPHFLMARSVACGHGIPVEVSSVHLFPCFGQTLVSQYVIDRCPDQRSILKKFVQQYGSVEDFDWHEETEAKAEEGDEIGAEVTGEGL